MSVPHELGSPRRREPGAARPFVSSGASTGGQRHRPGSAGGYRVGMASPVPQPSVVGPAAVRPPAADPAAIRACLSSEIVAVFDAEWEHALDAAKQSKDLAGIRDLLHSWRLLAYDELVEPGSYFRILAKAAHIQATGKPATGSVAGEEIRALIAARLAEAGVTIAEQGR